MKISDNVNLPTDKSGSIAKTNETKLVGIDSVFAQILANGLQLHDTEGRTEGKTVVNSAQDLIASSQEEIQSALNSELFDNNAFEFTISRAESFIEIAGNEAKAFNSKELSTGKAKQSNLSDIKRSIFSDDAIKHIKSAMENALADNGLISNFDELMAQNSESNLGKFEQVLNKLILADQTSTNENQEVFLKFIGREIGVYRQPQDNVAVRLAELDLSTLSVAINKNEIGFVSKAYIDGSDLNEIIHIDVALKDGTIVLKSDVMRSLNPGTADEDAVQNDHTVYQHKFDLAVATNMSALTQHTPSEQLNKLTNVSFRVKNSDQDISNGSYNLDDRQISTTSDISNLALSEIVDGSKIDDLSPKLGSESKQNQLSNLEIQITSSETSGKLIVLTINTDHEMIASLPRLTIDLASNNDREGALLHDQLPVFGNTFQQDSDSSHVVAIFKDPSPLERRQKDHTVSSADLGPLGDKIKIVFAEGLQTSSEKNEANLDNNEIVFPEKTVQLISRLVSKIQKNDLKNVIVRNVVPDLKIDLRSKLSSASMHETFGAKGERRKLMMTTKNFLDVYEQKSWRVEGSVAKMFIKIDPQTKLSAGQNNNFTILSDQSSLDTSQLTLQKDDMTSNHAAGRILEFDNNRFTKNQNADVILQNNNTLPKLDLLDAEFASKLAIHALEQTLNEQDYIEISLEPKSFGKMRLTASMDGVDLDIKIFVENQSTLNILRSTEGLLQAVSEQNGLKLAQYNVELTGQGDTNNPNSRDDKSDTEKGIGQEKRSGSQSNDADDVRLVTNNLHALNLIA